MNNANPEAKPLLHKLTETEIDPKQPWQDDILGRKDYAERLTNLMSTLSQPYVMGIDASYGGGKTFFVRRWQASLQNSGYNTVFFNAWESDFSNDPLAAFMSALDKAFPEKAAEEKINTGLKELVKIVAPALAKRGASYVLGEETAKELMEGGGREALDIAQKIAKAQMDEQRNAEEALETFTRELKAFVVALGQKEDTPSGPPLIVFVEELDRCRPNYAAEVLERIKHFFFVPGVLFVVSADRKHLGSCFSSIYGPDLDQDGYLARFVDNWFRLPDPDNESFAKYLIKEFRLVEDGFISDKFTLNPLSNEETVETLFASARTFATLFSTFANHYNYSLRRQEQIFSILNLALRGAGTKRSLFPTLYPVILFGMLETSDVLEMFLRKKDKTNLPHDLRKNLRNIIQDPSRTDDLHYTLVEAALTYDEKAFERRLARIAGIKRGSIEEIQRKIRECFQDKNPAQIAYEELKFWNAANAPEREPAKHISG